MKYEKGSTGVLTGKGKKTLKAEKPKKVKELKILWTLFDDKTLEAVKTARREIDITSFNCTKQGVKL